jgi:hypothetical protein
MGFVRFRAGLWAIALICLCWVLSCVQIPPAIAAVHTYPESATQVMYRSQQSLRDDQDRAWQAVLFKRLQHGQVQTLHLRLVGFPGAVEVAHPQPLQITTGTGRVFAAPDRSDQLPLPANVGEYDFLAVITQLEQAPPLRLSLSLINDQTVDLLVPPFVVREWLQVLDLTDAIAR